MGSRKDLLAQYGLIKNPYTDRTAEKSQLDGLSLYSHSDLAGFQPSETTYVFFGKRGSGKTTIRLQMQRAYESYNEQEILAKRSRGHFMVDLCRPGHLTACLRTFQQSIKCSNETWDAVFGDSWSSSDFVDAILSFAASALVAKLCQPNSEEGQEMLGALKADPRASRQALLLIHLYADTDAQSLALLRRELLPLRYTAVQLAVTAGVATSAVAGTALVASSDEACDRLSSTASRVWDDLGAAVPVLHSHPRLSIGACLAAASLGAYYYSRYAKARNLERARALTSRIRIVRQQPVELIAALLSRLFTPGDRASTIQALCLGVSSHQKMDHLTHLVQVLDYESVTVFCDCVDEVSLLDPVVYPGAIKAFAREACRNDLLNFGRSHLFFPDSRLALDLNTDKALKEARFDRHFVRDLTWSRHQLEELAERRFVAAQQAARHSPQSIKETWGEPASDAATNGHSDFSDLFKKVRKEDFSGALSKLSTPRETLLFMTELLNRMEAHPKEGVEHQDMDIAVTKALEQAV